MLGKVIIKNGQKKIQALTADTGTGAPVGSYLYLEKKSNPQGYLYCDGSTFDETAYPALYQYLGTNVLPDWREFSAVGAEQNTTSAVIATHDVYTEGQAKDDQLQDHAHDSVWVNSVGVHFQDGGSYNIDGNKNAYVKSNARKGTVTRGKRKAVFIYIKATSGLTENQQENVLNTINENNSYSTEEHPTGAKWIDGKEIYEQTFEVGIGISTGTWVDIVSKVSVPDIDKLIKHSETWGNNEQVSYACAVSITPSSSGIIRYPGVDTASMTLQTVTLEYTKTTD